MDSTTALRELGVTAGQLTAAERTRLDQDGFLPLPGILSAGQLQVIRRRLGELSAAEGDHAGIEVHREEGTDRLADLVNKDPVFEVCFTSPRVLAAVAHVLGDFTLSSLNSRAALPGAGQQRLHTDWGEPVPAGDYQVCNSIWLIDDFTPANGRPGSSRAATAAGSGPARRWPTPGPRAPAKSGCSARPAPWWSSTRTCGTAGPATPRGGRAGRCTPTSAAVAGNSSSISGPTSGPETLARLSPAARHILGV